MSRAGADDLGELLRDRREGATARAAQSKSAGGSRLDEMDAMQQAGPTFERHQLPRHDCAAVAMDHDRLQRRVDAQRGRLERPITKS